MKKVLVVLLALYSVSPTFCQTVGFRIFTKGIITVPKLDNNLGEYYEGTVGPIGLSGNAEIRFGLGSNLHVVSGLGFSRQITKLGYSGRVYEAGKAEQVPADKQIPVVYNLNTVTLPLRAELDLPAGNGGFEFSAGFIFNINVSGQLRDAKPLALGTSPDGYASVTYERVIRPEKLPLGSDMLDDFSRKATDFVLGIHYKIWNADHSGAIRFGLDYAMGLTNIVNSNNPNTRVYFGNAVKQRSLSMSLGYMWQF